VNVGKRNSIARMPWVRIPFHPPQRKKRVAAVDAPEAADRTKVGMVEGGFILRSECISRVIKFDSKQTNKKTKYSAAENGGQPAIKINHDYYQLHRLMPRGSTTRYVL
jgi:hypothetical protein